MNSVAAGLQQKNPVIYQKNFALDGRRDEQERAEQNRVVKAEETEM